MNIIINNALNVGVVDSNEDYIENLIRIKSNTDGILIVDNKSYPVTNGVGFIPESFAPNGSYPLYFTANGVKYDIGVLTRFGRIARYEVNTTAIINALMNKADALDAENNKIKKELAEIHKALGVKIIKEK